MGQGLLNSLREPAGANFDDMLETRDLEITTKSPRVSPDLAIAPLHDNENDLS